MSEIYYAIVFLPLLGFFIAGVFGRTLGDSLAIWIPTILLGVSALLSWYNYLNIPEGGIKQVYEIARWAAVGSFEFHWAIRVDTLSSVMFIVITSVSALVHLYSVGYMHHDESQPRFFAYLSLFTFAMLMLVSADNFVQMFFGWEGVGLASYLLIGFWYHKPSANAAAIKAFLVNRVGDIGFALGIFAAYKMTGALNFDDFFAKVPELAEKNMMFWGYEISAVTIIGILLFIGAMGKSAQLGLHTWLPDAMEGPTPVSALIHAATMVTAGVFMVCRLSPLYEYSQTALDVITIVGASTAFFAATVGLTQNDIKRVIAYSTCSQLGYMFFAAGLSAYPVAMFHLTTHAFFKALLFLGAGSVIHALGGEQDLRKMGGTWRHIKWTYMAIWIGSLSLAGMPFFAGFYSKDAILEVAYASHSAVGDYAFILGSLGAFMTAFYSWRLLFLAFHGTSRAGEGVMAHIHESPMVMLVPLFLLSVGAVFSGYLMMPQFMGDELGKFWGNSLVINQGHDALKHIHDLDPLVKYSPVIEGLMGIFLAYILYIKAPSIPGKLANMFKPLYNISYNKWYFDEIYNAILVRPAFCVGRILWQWGDSKIIDRFGPNGFAAAFQKMGRGLSKLQSGYIHHYILVMVLGLLIMALYLVRKMGGL